MEHRDGARRRLGVRGAVGGREGVTASEAGASLVVGHQAHGAILTNSPPRSASRLTHCALATTPTEASKDADDR
ncbi:hypothetical protein GCM10023340_37570 [Nocardioides marinquilinus]|uniref:Uncharacterized protein n=1 Tax=Nocardioides marinquilinus TaxID=1210400 RepID=A0ABP9PYZ0_9ACTN